MLPLLARCFTAIALLLAREALAQGTYAEAVELIKTGHPQQAIPLIEGIVSGAPKDLKARNLLGIALSGAGRKAEASEQYRLLLKQNPTFLPALKNLALNELELGDVESAREHFSAALRLSPEDPSIQFGMGHLAFTEGRTQEAIEHYEKSRGLHLQDPLAQLRYAASCVQSGQKDKALQALKLFPKQGPSQFQSQAGVLLAQLGEYGEAIPHFEVALSQERDKPELRFNLALAYLKSRNAKQAIGTLTEALTSGRATSELHSLLAQAYEADSQTKEAYESLRAAIRLDPRSEAPYAQLIALCLDHENQELGLEVANISLQQIPRSSQLHLQRGVIHALNSRSEEALSDFQAAVKLDPDAPLGYIAQSLMLIRMDRHADAVSILRARAKASPDDALTSWMLAEALCKSGVEPGTEQEREAVDALERSVKGQARLAQSRALLGKLMLARGDLKRAQVELEAALEIDSTSISAAYLLGQVYRKQGRIAEANTMFAKVNAAKAEDQGQAENRSFLRIIKDHLPQSAQ